ncbi:hypothetical protein EXS61_01870, partial [Candidatus Parcubacteria bacterium]|nr:hypothetical protein [Candidatus Parcubacteria bacterium]
MNPKGSTKKTPARSGSPRPPSRFGHASTGSSTRGSRPAHGGHSRFSSAGRSLGSSGPSRGGSFGGNRGNFGGSRGGSRGGGGGRGRAGMGERIDVSRFINKTVISEEIEVFKPEHNFTDFNINEQLKRSIIIKGYKDPTPIQDRAIPHILKGA